MGMVIYIRIPYYLEPKAAPVLADYVLLVVGCVRMVAIHKGYPWHWRQYRHNGIFFFHLGSNMAEPIFQK